MSSPADQFSILNKSGQNPNFQRPKAKPKVQRYRKGQGPEHEEPEDDDNDDIYTISNYTIEKDNDMFSVAESNVTTQKTREEEQQLAERLKKRRQVQRSVIVEESKAEEQAPAREKMETEKAEQNGEEEEVDNVARRRAKLKEKLLEQEKIAEDDIHLQNINEEDEMDEETNEPEEEVGIISMLKPVFVSKHEREVNKEKIEEEIALHEEQNRLKERRKAETKALLIEAIKKDDEAEKDEDNLSGGEMPNDDDDIDEANQYEQWKIRELKRLKREREERHKRDKERAEIERRRRLTDAERAHENKVLGSDDTLKPEKVQYKFMQKYYHKGAFYQDSDDPIFKRDYNVGVGEDLWDKSGAPGILQKRRGQFGMRGGTKYTHLTDQDTTNFDPQFRVDDTLLNQARRKQAGFKGSEALDRPTARKR